MNAGVGGDGAPPWVLRLFDSAERAASAERRRASRVRTECRLDILAAFRAAGRPLTRMEVVRALREAGTPHGAGTVGKRWPT